MPELTQAHREIMWNISHAWLMYVLFGLAMAVFAFGVWKRVSFWRQGKPDSERLGDWGIRLKILIKELLFQNRVRKSWLPGIFHSFIFYSFVVFTITTAIVALDYDFGTNFFKGYIYVFFTVGSDIGGLLVLIGLSIAYYRRLVSKPSFLPGLKGDLVSLTLLLCIIITGFLAEGLRIAVKGDPWSLLSPIGYATSFLFTHVSAEMSKAIHVAIWWTHLGLAFWWIATVPFTKFFHLLALPTNVMFSKLKPRGQLFKEDIDAMFEAEDFDEENFTVGVEKTSQLTWKQRLELDACINCGRCDDVCPAVLAKEPFGPRDLVQNVREVALKVHGKDVEEGADAIVGNAFDDEFVWLCRTCSACMEVCPASIEHVDAAVEIRRNEVVMQGRLPAEAAKALKQMESLGNPFGPQSERVEWVESLKAPVIAAGEEVDYIYWIGCCTTFDPMKQKIAADLCELLTLAGVSFGLLGEDESCCGDPARLLGQEHLFQTLAKEQVAKITSRKFKKLLVSCPHCYNVFANEYPNFDCHLDVIHHTELLQELIQNGTIKPQPVEGKALVYHDPCYLGRVQKVYEAPRKVIASIPGHTVTEMKNHANNSLCCGGGGGHYWMDLKKGERINNFRVQQAIDEKADAIVAGCSYCYQMLDDSIKLLDKEESMKVIDIASLLLESVKQQQVQ